MKRKTKRLDARNANWPPVKVGKKKVKLSNPVIRPSQGEPFGGR